MDALLALAWLVTWCVTLTTFGLTISFVVNARWGWAIFNAALFGSFGGVCFLVSVEMMRAPT